MLSFIHENSKRSYFNESEIALSLVFDDGFIKEVRNILFSDLSKLESFIQCLSIFLSYLNCFKYVIYAFSTDYALIGTSHELG